MEGGALPSPASGRDSGAKFQGGKHGANVFCTFCGRTGAEARTKELKPTQRMAASKSAPHSDSLVLTEAGCYMLKWSNAFSWMSGKTLHWRADLDVVEDSGNLEPQPEA